jgi:hypothetical protein
MSDLIDERQQKRLRYIDLCAYVLGFVNRKLLLNRFDIKEAYASRDIKKYQALTGERLQYDHKHKGYVPTDWFTPLYEHTTEEAIDFIAEGRQSLFCEPQFSSHSCTSSLSIIRPDLERIYHLLRSIYWGDCVDISYLSRSSGESNRLIAPHGFIRSGGFDYVRAYDYSSREFRTFKLNRVASSVASSVQPKEDESRGADTEWNQLVQVTIKAHPRASHKQTIEFDYGLQRGRRKVDIPKVAILFFLADWNIAPKGHENLPSDFYPLVVEDIVEI